MSLNHELSALFETMAQGMEIKGESVFKALDEGKLEGIKGIGEKKLQSIKQGIELQAKSAGRMGIGEALPVAQSLAAQLRKVAGVRQVEFAGSLRRRRETVGDVDLICAV